MTPWLWIALVSNLTFWAVFVALLLRHRPGATRTVVGVLHLLLAAFFSVAPIRSLIDPAYPGLGFGVLRFEGRGATLPATLVLVWALACAYLAVTRGAGRSLWWVAAFDLLMAANLAAGVLAPGSSNDIQFGEHLTISGHLGVAIMLLLFVAGPALSGWWAARKALMHLEVVNQS